MLLHFEKLVRLLTTVALISIGEIAFSTAALVLTAHFAMLVSRFLRPSSDLFSTTT